MVFLVCLALLGIEPNSDKVLATMICTYGIQSKLVIMEVPSPSNHSVKPEFLPNIDIASPRFRSVKTRVPSLGILL